MRSQVSAHVTARQIQRAQAAICRWVSPGTTPGASEGPSEAFGRVALDQIGRPCVMRRGEIISAFTTASRPERRSGVRSKSSLGLNALIFENELIRFERLRPAIISAGISRLLPTRSTAPVSALRVFVYYHFPACFYHQPGCVTPNRNKLSLIPNNQRAHYR